MANGLLPARRVGGSAASAASPDTGASRVMLASTSIKASRPGLRSAIGIGIGGTRLVSKWGSCRWSVASGSTGAAATGWRGALRREVQAL